VTVFTSYAPAAMPSPDRLRMAAKFYYFDKLAVRKIPELSRYA
jgi:hypothetical protein